MGQQEILIDFGKGISSRIRAYCKDFPYPGGGSLWEVGLVGSHSGPRGGRLDTCSKIGYVDVSCETGSLAEMFRQLTTAPEGPNCRLAFLLALFTAEYSGGVFYAV